MLTKTLSEAKKKQRNILIKAMNNDIGSIDSAKDSWNPAQISERAKDISYTRSLVDTWNPAQLNEALRMLDLPIIDTWNPAQIEEQRRNLVFYLTERTLTGDPITVKILGNLTPEVTGIKVTMNPIQDLHGYDYPWVHDDNEQVPYNFRAVQGTVTDVGNIIFDKIVGGTVAWNQLGKNNDSVPYTKYGLTINKVIGESKVTISGTTANVPGDINLYFGASSIPTVSGHKYYLASTSNTFGLFGYGTGVSCPIRIGGSIATVSANGTMSFSLRPLSMSDGVTINETVNYGVFDITQMFGSTIADYIYSLEQSTPGAGVAWFRKLFPNDYYEYNAGELLSVEGLESHVMRDANDNIIGNYPLDDSLTLRGIPKLDASNNLYYDGDTYASDGTLTRRYGVVDLGTLNWTRTNNTSLTTAGAYFSANLNNGIASNLNKICSKYAIDSILGLSNIIAQRGGDVDKFAFCYTASAIGIVDSAYTDAASFKAAMSGVMLVHELATPTTEQADPYTNPQTIDEYGTEEYVGSFIPVGHETDHANICPISGRTEASVTRTAGEDVETKNHQYSETIYGGVDDFVNGGLSVEWGYIAEYDGETLPGEWISDRDVYAPNTTPTTGAEVAYRLATATTVETTPEDITLLKGENVLSTDGDSIELKYKQNF